MRLACVEYCSVIPVEASNKSSDNPKTILIADESAMVRAIIRHTLERDTDYMICRKAIDGPDAVSKAKELEPDLIIGDVKVPELNGIEVERSRLVVAHAHKGGRNGVLHELLQGEFAVLHSSHRFVTLRVVQIAKTLNQGALQALSRAILKRDGGKLCSCRRV